MSPLAVLAALVLAAAPGPYPAQHEGSGSQPTAGAGVFAGTPFRARSALVRYELGASCCPSRTIGEVSVYVFEQAGVRCATLDPARSTPFFSYTVETNGAKLPVGRPLGSSFFQQASFNVIGLTTGFQPGVRIVFSRIDTSQNALWHGAIAVPRASYNGKVYSLAATFAAPWCGTTKG